MAFQLDVLVTQSLFDRLIDQDPQNRNEAALTHAESVRRLRAAVRRDIEWLLNSRRVAFAPDLQLKELNRSLYIYGLPDISTVSFASMSDQDLLLASIEKALQVFEPRLTSVRVIPVRDPAKKLIQRLDFRIEALLVMDPSPEQITFDTTLDGVSQSYKIKADAAD